MPIELCKEDFNEIKVFFESQNILTPFKKENVGAIKKIHNSSFSFLLFKKRLKVANHADIYIAEMQSDYLQIIALVLKGYEKLAMILLRDILENTLKFIYYFHHPIEFAQLADRNKNYISFEDLNRYVNEHPEIKAHSEDLHLLNRIKTKYSELSKYVHSKDSNYMQLVEYLKQIEFNKKFASEFITELNETHSIIMTLLILFFQEKYASLSIPDRRFIMNSISKKDKKYLISL